MSNVAAGLALIKSRKMWLVKLQRNCESNRFREPNMFILRKM